MQNCTHTWTHFIIVSKSYRKCTKCKYKEPYKETPRLNFKNNTTLDFWTPPKPVKQKTPKEKNKVPLHFIAWKQGHWVSTAKPKNNKINNQFLPRKSVGKLKMMPKDYIEDNYIKIVRL